MLEMNSMLMQGAGSPVALLTMINALTSGPAIIAYFVILLITVGMACWAIGLQSRFTYSFKELHKNAAMMALGYFPRTLAIVVIFTIFYNLTINMFFMVMFLPAVMVNFQSMLMEPVFRKYMPEEE